MATSYSTIALLRPAIKAVLVLLIISYPARAETQERSPQGERIRFDSKPALADGIRNERIAYVEDIVVEFDEGLRYVIALRPPVHVILRRCGRAGLENYELRSRTITVCDETINWFANRLIGELSAPYLREGIRFILSHEVAHALTADLATPLTGDVEAAIDELGTILILESPVGFAVSGGAMFLNRVAQEEDDWATYTHHGSTLQRRNRVTCLESAELHRGIVALEREFPANPRFTEMRENSDDNSAHMLGSRRRLEECIGEYADALVNWQRLLGTSASLNRSK